MTTDVQLECFFSLAETLNFSETAKHLYISQQAVSKNISKLEGKVGFPLFYRNPHNVQLTPWGKEYLTLCKAFLADCQHLTEDYQQENNTIKILTLNQPDFEPVKRIHPFTIPGTQYLANIELSFDTPAVLVERLLSHEADIIVTIDRFVQNKPGVVVKNIFPLEAALLVSKNHPKYHPGVSYKVFKGEGFVAGVESTNFFETRESIMHDIEVFDLQSSSVIIVSDAEKALSVVAKGDGIILGSVMACPPYASEIATVPIGIMNHIACAWNENHCHSYTEAFVDFLSNEFKMAEKMRLLEHANDKEEA